MTNKHFTFYAEHSWCGNGCSCCEDTLMECYNSEEVDGSLGSSYDERDCYVQAVITVLGRDNLTTEDQDIGNLFYELTFDKVLAIVERLGIIVDIVEEGDDGHN